MSVISELRDRIPEQRLDLVGIPDGPVKTAALEAAYKEGFTGCFLPGMDGPAGAAAQYAEDEFRDVAGKDNYLFEQLSFDESPLESTEQGYIASQDAFTAWNRDRAPDSNPWIFGIFQNYGNCVDASLVELLHGALGTRAEEPVNNEQYHRLAAFYAYAFRGYCSHGWYIPTAASITLQHGYCFALPRIANVPYLTEQDSEIAVSVTWCRSGPPRSFQQEVASRQWRFEPGSISRFSGGVEALRDIIRRKGQVHHGSNYTAGSSTPGRPLRRIGGHAQTLFGGDWSDRTLKFFRDQGVRAFSLTNFPVVHHQTWGGSWSGATASEFWPEWWGPRPQGAWVTTAEQAVSQLFRSATVYLPRFRGWPRATPIPPAPRETTALTGTLHADNASPIRGELIAGTGSAATAYIIVPDGRGGYHPVKRTF